MDSSSDSDEFYECDDAEEDVPIPKDSKQELQAQKAIPVPDVTTKQTNTDNKQVDIVSSEKTKTIALANSETSNNNIDTKNKQNAKEAETVKNNNVSTDIDNIQVEEANRLDLEEECEKKCAISATKEEKTMILDQVDCEMTITSTNSTSCNKSAVQTNDLNDSEDLWGGEDNWSKMDQQLAETKSTPPCSPEENIPGIKSESLPDKATIKETSKPKVSFTSPPNPKETDENLWGDEDDWGNLDTVPNNQEKEPEEDLWGDGDGWGVDTPQETPKRSNVTSDSQPKTDDLWEDGDNWGFDETEETTQSKTPIATDAKSALNALTKEESSSWGGWGNWNISSVLSTAANITTSVSQGITTVLESGIGVPDPEELARIHKAEEESRRQSGEEVSNDGASPEENFVPFGLGNFVPGVSTITKLVETTGTKVITKGLGTLETIGKKTYEVLQENDPQLKKKRALLKYLEGEKPVLSTMLREAKERAETENKDRERRHFAKKANYETMFDDYTGLVHLEALEMLSKQCDYKLESILSQSRDVTEVQETMEQIKDLCELAAEDDDEETDFDEMKSKMSTAIEEINIGISCEKILDSYGEVLQWIEAVSLDSNTPEEIHSNAIENLAKITAMSVEQYHKAAELLLVKEHRSTADEADSLVQLTNAISALIGLLSTKYTEKLKDFTAQASNEEIKTLISNIYLEHTNLVMMECKMPETKGEACEMKTEGVPKGEEAPPLNACCMKPKEENACQAKPAECDFLQPPKSGGDGQ